MLIQPTIGLPSAKQAAGSTPNAIGGNFAELLMSKLMPDYYSLVKLGLVYSLATLGQNATGFTGGAAGTPLLGLYNPLTSGKDLVLLEAALGIRTTGTAATTNSANHFGAAQGSTAVTGTNTNPRNVLTQQAQGSVATGQVNTANTGALASNLIRPAFSLGNLTTTAGVNVIQLRDEIRGGIVIPPGGYYAFGLAATLTAGSIDASVIWAELPA